MLLPFAGFLYGSVLDLDLLRSHPATVWLLYFVFPVQSARPLAVGLIAHGLGFFILAAIQIYRGKMKKGGLVKGGMYRISRNPQYLALTLVSVGIILIWGRVFVVILLFLMTFAYYVLARKEEADCLARFGEEYEAYARTVAFLVPGDRIFRGAGRVMEAVVRPRGLRLLLGFVIWVGLGAGLSLGVLHWRLCHMVAPAYAAAQVLVAPDRPVDLYLLSGFAHQIEGTRELEDFDSFWRDLAKRLASSSKLKQALSEVEKPYDCLVAFPMSRTMRAKKERPALEGDFVLLAFDGKGSFEMDRFAESRNRSTAVAGFEIESLNANAGPVGSPDRDAIVGSVFPLPEVASKPREKCRRRMMDGLLNLYLSGLGSKLKPLYRIIER
jgi:protein-S-isoprenylcysteine O-methyltransferase Ste14